MQFFTGKKNLSNFWRNGLKAYNSALFLYGRYGFLNDSGKRTCGNSLDICFNLFNAVALHAGSDPIYDIFASLTSAFRLGGIVEKGVLSAADWLEMTAYSATCPTLLMMECIEEVEPESTVKPS